MRTQTRAAVRTFGFGEDNDVRASDVALDWPHGTTFSLHAGGESRRVRIHLLGRHQVYPILAAVTVALAEGICLDQVIPALEALPATPGRLEVVRLRSGALLLRDDFKSPLETVDAALDVLAEIPAGRRIVVLGDVQDPPGSPESVYRRLGKRIAQVATRAIFVGDNSQRYAAAARRGGLPGDALIDAGTEALQAVDLLGDLAPGDVVLIKGRRKQRLGRIALALMGRQVRCDITICDARLMSCECCPMLERGWNGLQVVV